MRSVARRRRWRARWRAATGLKNSRRMPLHGLDCVIAGMSVAFHLATDPTGTGRYTLTYAGDIASLKSGDACTDTR